MERLLLILLLSFLIPNCYAQDSLNYGKVKPDTAFDCKNDNSRWPDLGVGSICNSTNEFELRLQGFDRPGSYSQMIVLTYKDKKWDVKKYERRGSSLGNALTSTSYNNNYDRVQKYIFGLVFDTLRNNGAFTLPNQEELHVKGDIMDGAAYRLTFKVNKYFRSYWFENPEDYLEQNPNVTELKKYIAIVRILNSLF
jgi:hypothetical protein